MRPFNVGIRTVILDDIFAGKIHAVLVRGWKGRVKGRDWYDWSWLVRQKAVLNLKRLAIHMRQAGFLRDDEALKRERFEQIMLAKIDQLDFKAAKADIQPFITDIAQITDWSADFFRYILTQTNIKE